MKNLSSNVRRYMNTINIKENGVLLFEMILNLKIWDSKFIEI